MKQVERNSNAHSSRPLEAHHDDVHADMPALALAIGQPEEGEEDHELRRPVDIARHRRVEELAAHHVPHGHQDQHDDRDASDQVQRALDLQRGAVEPRQAAVVAEDG
jgi:hypothetical protein